MAGFAWEPSSRTSVSASIGERFFGRTYYLSASHRTRRTVWNISYDEAVTTTRSQFFLPAAIDTAALLDRLFTGVYPDPVQRKLAVAITSDPGQPARSAGYFGDLMALLEGPVLALG